METEGNLYYNYYEEVEVKANNQIPNQLHLELKSGKVLGLKDNN